MRIRGEPDRVVLKELAELLASSQMPVQMHVASEAGVTQSLVSRALNGHLRRVTAKVERLLDYARSRVDAAELAADAAAEVDEEIDGSPASIGSVGTGMRRRPALDGFRREALKGVEAYLADGYDPRLVVEQLAVLRRAQRMRRPGRTGGGG